MSAQPVHLLHISLKRILIVLFKAILGVGLGLSQAKAEYLYNQYVDGAGNVVIAGTNGYSSGGAFQEQCHLVVSRELPIHVAISSNSL